MCQQFLVLQCHPQHRLSLLGAKARNSLRIATGRTNGDEASVTSGGARGEGYAFQQHGSLAHSGEPVTGGGAQNASPDNDHMRVMRQIPIQSDRGGRRLPIGGRWFFGKITVHSHVFLFLLAGTRRELAPVRWIQHDLIEDECDLLCLLAHQKGDSLL